MTITDNELKRLKEFIALGFQPHTAWDVNEMRDLILAMLARLEAAEKALDVWEAFSLEIHSRVRSTEYEFVLRMKKANAMEAWRKACGK